MTAQAILDEKETETPEGLRKTDDIMAEIEASGLAEEFYMNWDEARANGVTAEFVSDEALTYNIAQKIGIDIGTKKEETEEEIEEEKTMEAQTQTEDLKTGTVKVIAVEESTWNGKSRWSIKGELDGVGVRFFSTLRSPDVTEQATYTFQWVEKPNPKKPEYPYLNLRKIAPAPGQKTLSEPVATPATTSSATTTSTPTTQKLVPPAADSKSVAIELGMAKNNAATLVASVIRGNMANGLSGKKAIDEALPLYWPLVKALFAEGTKLREETLNGSD